MVGGTTHQPQQAPQLAPPSSSTAPTTTPEEDELLKRNTDCVYFLASPLTCKKGSECEYRHSDIARVNPRDCWYWLNGNCLNPKCGFRHPPLDGLLGTDGSTPMGPSVPAIPKQGVACIFFQKGFCLKGHLCPFLHGPPNSVINKAVQSGPVNHPPTEPPKMAYSHPEKSIPERKFTQKETVQKPVEFLLLPQGKQARNGGSIDKKVAPPSSMDVEEPPRHKSSKSKRGHVLDNNNRIVNGKDGDEYSREPSPGFDVLVDNEVGDSEYYHNEDEFGRCSDMYREQCRVASSERKPYRTTSGSPDESDLRHRIAKQRRGSENRNHSSDHMMPRRESHHLSSRLRGRIKIPGRSISPTNRNESRVERVIDMGRKHQTRYTSPSFNQSRLRDRIKGRASEDINDARDYYYYKGSRGRQDMMSDNDTMFTGPKRLLNEGYEQQMNDRESQGKRKYPQSAAADDLSFEGPKPLSEILKRKRGADALIPSLNNHKEREIISICTNKQEYKSKFSEAEKQTEKDKSLLNYIASEVENEEGLIDEDAMLDQELEAYDDNNGDYNYEQIDGEEDYNLDEGENHPVEEYVDEEDGDEYAKKESVSYL